MGYYDWLQGFRNFYIQERVNTYGAKPPIFIDISPEAQKDSKTVEWFEMTDRGAKLWVKDERYPIRGNTPSYKVMILTQFKKMIPMWINFLLGRSSGAHTFKKKNIFEKAWIVLAMATYREFFINWLWYGLQEVFADVQYYVPPTRELYRLINNEKMRDIICAVIEYDTAYRYRYQDLVGELNKENWEKNHYKEIQRLTDIAIMRECHPNDELKILGLNKIAKIVPFFLIYLRFNRKLSRDIKRMGLEIDVDKSKLSVEDIYWTNRYPDYNFRGLDLETRLKEYENTKKIFLSNHQTDTAVV